MFGNQEKNMDRVLEDDCRRILGWTDQKIARSRKQDMLDAMNDHKEGMLTKDKVIDIVSESHNPVSTRAPNSVLDELSRKPELYEASRKPEHPSRKPELSESLSHKPEPINLLPRTKLEEISTKLEPVPWERLLYDGNISELSSVINSILTRLQKCECKLQNKQLLLTSRRLDLLDDLLLRSSMERDDLVIQKLHILIATLSNELVQSIQTKRQLLIILQAETVEDETVSMNLEPLYTCLTQLERCCAQLTGLNQ